MEVTTATIREEIVEGDLDHFRVVVEQLADEFDVLDLANDVKISAGIGQEDVNVSQRFKTRAKFGGAFAHATGERF